MQRKIREFVFNRDRNTCIYCGAKQRFALAVDHFVPKHICKHDEINNLVTSCRRCNSIKIYKRFSSVKDAMIYVHMYIERTNGLYFHQFDPNDLPELPKNLCPASQVAEILWFALSNGSLVEVQ